eukprot:3099279-Rhodomonas_salina.2
MRCDLSQPRGPQRASLLLQATRPTRLVRAMSAPDIAKRIQRAAWWFDGSGATCDEQNAHLTTNISLSVKPARGNSRRHVKTRQSPAGLQTGRGDYQKTRGHMLKKIAQKTTFSQRVASACLTGNSMREPASA